MIFEYKVKALAITKESKLIVTTTSISVIPLGDVMSRSVFLHVPGYRAGIAVIATTGIGSNDIGDGFALKEITRRVGICEKRVGYKQYEAKQAKGFGVIHCCSLWGAKRPLWLGRELYCQYIVYGLV